MRKGILTVLCAFALAAVLPAQAGDTDLPLNDAEKAAFCTLETILRDAREKMETEVASILFGSGGA